MEQLCGRPHNCSIDCLTPSITQARQAGGLKRSHICRIVDIYLFRKVFKSPYRVWHPAASTDGAMPSTIDVWHEWAE